MMHRLVKQVSSLAAALDKRDSQVVDWSYVDDLVNALQKRCELWDAVEKLEAAVKHDTRALRLAYFNDDEGRFEDICYASAKMIIKAAKELE